MFKLIVAKDAQTQLRKIPSGYRRLIVISLRELKENLSLGEPLSRELTGYFKLRIGVYRAIYKVNQKDKIITIMDVDHRAKIYN